MASASPPPLSADGLWFWDGSRWRSLVHADGQRFWDGNTWIPLPPHLAGTTLQPPSGPPPGLVEAPWSPPAPITPPPPAGAPPPPLSPPGALASPPGYAPPASPPPPAPPQAPVEPRPAWLPADAPWPPATFSASPDVPLTVDAPISAPAPGAVPWANVYSEVVAASVARQQGYSYAGFWIRFIAYLIDGLILWIPITLLWFGFLGGREAIISTDTAVYAAGLRTLQGIALVASFLYFVFFWTQGSTPGMRVVGIRVADESTFASIGVGRAILRFIGFLVAGYCCYIGFLWSIWDSHHQGWHDKMGQSVVIHR